MIEITDYKKGDIIRFKDMRNYDVLEVRPTGLLVAEQAAEFGMSSVHFFRPEFLKEAHRRNYIIPERSKKKKDS